MKKWISRIINLFLVLIFVFGAYVCYCVFSAGKNKVPNIMGYSLLRVSTGSMSGTLEIGDVILVKKTDASQIKEGDIITFYSSDPQLDHMPNTHRVIGISQDSEGRFVYKTKGDDSDLEDKYPAYGEDLIGRYVKTLSVLSKVLTLFSNNYSFFFLLIIPLGIIIAIEAVNFSKLLKKKTDFVEKETEKLKDEKK